jgi:hypothetical protein
VQLDHYLEVLKIKPGAFPGSSALAAARAAGTFTPAHEAFWAAARRVNGDAAGTRKLIDVLLLHRSMTEADVMAGITAALRVGAVSADVVALEARRHAGPGGANSDRHPSAHTVAPEHRVVSLTQRRLAEPAAVIAGLPADTRPLPSVGAYDELLARRRGAPETPKPGSPSVTSEESDFADFLADRRQAPRDDLMSALVAAEIGDQRLSDDELLGFCLLLLIAGHETTTNLLGNAAVVLAGHPQSRHRLAADPTLIGHAVEELLRYDSPVQGLSRVLTTDVTLHGTTMSQGDSVLMLFGSANRDERVFARPDVFDIDRKPEHQVAFGRGIHFCLGAALARLEARISLGALLSRLPDWAVDVDSAVRLRSGPIRGYLSLPIMWPAS